MAQNWNSLQLSELWSFGIAILLLVSYHCPLLHSVVLPRQMICWNWIGMMNGCGFTWIVIKSWVFCKAKFSLCDLNDHWYLFFCQSRLTIIYWNFLEDALSLKYKESAALYQALDSHWRAFLFDEHHFISGNRQNRWFWG